ncbi:MAG: DUF3298 domain-containing protein [Candidatus Margulisbacteria bacterium]|nr:DUF3298 domain-containing protein [Candidatus Margulisiibacteriota bacterium]
MPASAAADRQIKEKTKDLDINIVYPAGDKISGPVIEKFVKAEVSAFKKDLPETKPNPDWAYQLSIDYETFSHRDLIGYKFTVFSFPGGAHPMTRTVTMTFDKKRGRQVGLADLFRPGYLKKISALTIKELLKRDLKDDKWVKEGASPDPKHYNKFILTDKYLIIYFDPYEVACYAYGGQEVKIPLSQLKNILK